MSNKLKIIKVVFALAMLVQTIQAQESTSVGNGVKAKSALDMSIPISTVELENCNPFISYPLEGELVNNKVKNNFKITFPKNYVGDKNIRIYKVSNLVNPPQNGELSKFNQSNINLEQLSKTMEDAFKGKSVLSQNLKISGTNSASLVLEKNSLTEGTYMAFVGSGKCNSKPLTFSVQSANINIQSFTVACGKTYGSYTYTVVAANLGNVAFVTSATIFTSAGGSISGITQTPLTGTIIPAGVTNPIVFTGSFNYSGSYPSTIIVEIKGYQQGNPLLTSSDTEIANLLACVCKDCDDSKLDWKGSIKPNAQIPGQYLIAGNITISGLSNIYGVEMQMVSYGYIANPSECTLGVSTLEQSGVFIKNGSTINGIAASLMNETVSGLSNSNNNISKDIKINSPTPIPSTIPINLTIGLPSPINGLSPSCCAITNNICIKVKVFYDVKSCKSCIYTFCFPKFTNK